MNYSISLDYIQLVLWSITYFGLYQIFDFFVYIYNQKYTFYVLRDSLKLFMENIRSLNITTTKPKHG